MTEKKRKSEKKEKGRKEGKGKKEGKREAGKKQKGKQITYVPSRGKKEEFKLLIHWVSGTTSGSNSSLGLFYSIYLGPEIKNLEETPYYG